MLWCSHFFQAFPRLHHPYGFLVGCFLINDFLPEPVILVFTSPWTLLWKLKENRTKRKIFKRLWHNALKLFLPLNSQFRSSLISEWKEKKNNRMFPTGFHAVQTPVGIPTESYFCPLKWKRCNLLEIKYSICILLGRWLSVHWREVTV